MPLLGAEVLDFEAGLMLSSGAIVVDDAWLHGIGDAYRDVSYI